MLNPISVGSWLNHFPNTVVLMFFSVSSYVKLSPDIQFQIWSCQLSLQNHHLLVIYISNHILIDIIYIQYYPSGYTYIIHQMVYYKNMYNQIYSIWLYIYIIHQICNNIYICTQYNIYIYVYVIPNHLLSHGRYGVRKKKTRRCLP